MTLAGRERAALESRTMHSGGWGRSMSDGSEHWETAETNDDFLNDWLVTALGSGHSSVPSTGNSESGTASASASVSVSGETAEQLIEGLHLDLPELSGVLPIAQSPSVAANRNARTQTRMTNVGYRMSQMVLSATASGDGDPSLGLEDLTAESGDVMVDTYGVRRRKNRPGKRGRPRGSTKPATQFGRGSTTHALPPAVAALMGQANVAYVQQRYEQAIELYLQVVQRAPGASEPYYSLGLVHEELGDADRAASYFLLAAHLQQRPEAELWRKAAAMLVTLPGRREQACYCLERAARNVGNDADGAMQLLWLRAKLLLELGQFRMVMGNFSLGLRAALRADANNTSMADGSSVVHFQAVARLALKMSLAYMAARLFEALLRKSPSAASVTWSHLNLVVELREAEEDWQAVIGACEEFGLGLWRRKKAAESLLPQRRRKDSLAGSHSWDTAAVLLQPHGSEELDGDDAFEEHDALESILPHVLALKYLIAKLRLKQPVDRLRLNALLDEEETPGKLIEAAADALLDVDPQAALRLYLRLIEKGLPSSREARALQSSSSLGVRLGQAYRRAGHLDSARETFEAVLEVETDNVKARRGLAECFRAQGKVDLALEALRGVDGIEGDAHREGANGAAEFIDWHGVNDVFVRMVGLPLEREQMVEKEANDRDGDSADDDTNSNSDSDYVASDEEPESISDSSDDLFADFTPGSKRGHKGQRPLRFGPQRTRRLRQATKARPVEYSPVQQKTIQDHAQVILADGVGLTADVLASARTLLQDYLENGAVFAPTKTYNWNESAHGLAAKHGMSLAQWSEALLAAVRLLWLAGRAQGDEEANVSLSRLVGKRLLGKRSLLLDATANGPNHWRWRLLSLLMPLRLGNGEQVLRAMRWFFLVKPGNARLALLPRCILKVLVQHDSLASSASLPSTTSTAFSRLYFDPINFRFLTRLAHKAASPSLFVLLGHQSMQTQSYDEACRSYLQALASGPVHEMTLCYLYLAVACGARAFQRTCTNPTGKMLQALAFLQHYLTCSEENRPGHELYNVARWMQAQGWTHLAVRLYQSLLARPIADVDDSLRALCRYNLSRALMYCGSYAAARAVLSSKQ